MELYEATKRPLEIRTSRRDPIIDSETRNTDEIGPCSNFMFPSVRDVSVAILYSNVKSQLRS
jgi:hypothetical protein